MESAVYHLECVRFAFTVIYDQRNVIKRKQKINHYFIITLYFVFWQQLGSFVSHLFVAGLHVLNNPTGNSEASCLLPSIQCVESSLQMCSLAIDSLWSGPRVLSPQIWC